MALSRRTGQRFQGSIWPGFVDAMTGLLLVLMFVLTIFMVVQFVLRETITGQETELDSLSAEVAALADALGLEERRGRQLQARLGALDATLAAREDELAQAQGQIAAFEDQVAAMLAQQRQATQEIATLQQERGALLSEQEALNLALAARRAEIDAQAEAARLAAAQREALEALVADLRRNSEELGGQLATVQSELDAKEAARLAEAAAAEALRARLQNADAELTALTLSLEAQRREAEETLTLLAAAQAARDKAEGQLSAADRQAALLATANAALSEQEAISAAAQRETALLNQQVAALRNQLGSLQALLDEAQARDAAAQVQLQSLGSDLNTALARVAAEEKRRRELEEAERKRLEAEAADLEQYRSEFFGRLRNLLGAQEGVRIVGDRFVFASEVLFPAGSADLSDAGRGEIAKVVRILAGVTDEIPAEIDWVIQVDGHTDNTPLSGLGEFADNWELSQARALSVVRYMAGALGVPPNRLSANGFGEYQPVNPADTAQARAQNRRIELKFTEK